VQHEDRAPEPSPPPEAEAPAPVQPSEEPEVPPAPEAPTAPAEAHETTGPKAATPADATKDEAPPAPDEAAVKLPGRGEIVEATIRRLAPFGAFVRLADGRKGLIHISQIAEEFVKEIKDHVHVGDVVRARITGVSEDGKVDLSIKKVKPRPKPPRPPKAKRRQREGEDRAETRLPKPTKEFHVNPLADLLGDVEKNLK